MKSRSLTMSRQLILAYARRGLHRVGRKEVITVGRLRTLHSVRQEPIGRRTLLRALSTAPSASELEEKEKEKLEKKAAAAAAAAAAGADRHYLRPSEIEIEAISSGSDKGLKDLQEEYKLYQRARQNPKDVPPEVTQNVSDVIPSGKGVEGAIVRARAAVMELFKSLGRYTWLAVRNPRLLVQWTKDGWVHLKEGLHHYWLGFKLLWQDMKTARKILGRILQGSALTRRERKQLLRTTSDIFRMVPLSFFLIVPFMEFLLPFALRLFPNMLPSTFQDTMKKEETMKKELRMRLALAGFLQETVFEMAASAKAKQKKATERGDSADAEEHKAALQGLEQFVQNSKMGHISNDDITRFAKHFKDELTLENTNRGQLVSMCLYMGLPPFGSDNFLRFQLRSHLRSITQDDQRILWEGLASLTKGELQEACRERGMRATGLTKEGYKRQLRQWLDLSITKQVPISLLIMSRAFTLESPDPAQALAQSISAMDDSVVTEVMIEAASKEERDTAEYRAIKLQSLERQNELIEEERRKLEAAKERKAAKEKEEESAAAAAKKEEEMSAAKLVGDAEAGAADEEAVVASAVAVDAASPSIQVQEEPLIREKDVIAGQKVVAPLPDEVEVKAVPPEEDVSAAAPSTPTLAPEAAEEKVSEDSRPPPQLTVEELRALESLTNPSSVLKEKAQLAQMKAALEDSIQQAEADLAVAKESSAEEELQELIDAKQSTLQKVQRMRAAVIKVEAGMRTKGRVLPKVVESSEEVLAEPGADADAATKGATKEVDKSLQRVQNKLASMLDKLEKDIQEVENKIGDSFHVLDRDKDGVVGAEELAFVIQHILSSHNTEEEALSLVAKLDVDGDGQISVKELMDWVERYADAEGDKEVFNNILDQAKAKSIEEKKS